VGVGERYRGREGWEKKERGATIEDKCVELSKINGKQSTELIGSISKSGG